MSFLERAKEYMKEMPVGAWIAIGAGVAIVAYGVGKSSGYKSAVLDIGNAVETLRKETAVLGNEVLNTLDEIQGDIVIWDNGGDASQWANWLSRVEA